VRAWSVNRDAFIALFYHLPTEYTDNKLTMSIREITWNWKLECIETARRAI